MKMTLPVCSYISMRRHTWVLLTAAVLAAVPGYAAPPMPATPPLPSTMPATTTSMPAWTDAELRPDRIAETLQAVLRREGQADGLLKTLQTRSQTDAALLPSLAVVSIEAGDLPVARTVLEQLVKASTHAGDWHTWGELATLREFTGDDAGAVAAIEQTLKTCTDPAVGEQLRLRLALLAYDMDKPEVAAKALRATIKEGSAPEKIVPAAAIIANLYGQPELGLELLNTVGQTKTYYAELLRGQLLFNCQKPAEAVTAFEYAGTLTNVARERRFIYERMISSARAAGTLSPLADRWLHDAQMPADRLVPLAMVLRELRRCDDLLALLGSAPQSEAHREILHSNTFQREVIATTLDVGRQDAAEKIYRQLIEQEPDQEEWILGLARMAADQDRLTEADAIFEKAIAQASTARALAHVSDLALDTGRNGVALRAAEAMAKFGKSEQVTSLLLRSRITLDNGDATGAKEFLSQAAGLAKDDETLILNVADVAEQLGDRNRAITILQNLGEKTRNDAINQRLAWLLEQDGRLLEAQAIWQQVWATATNNARKQEARGHLLELASRSGTIADLAVTLEDNLAAHKADDADLAMLIDLYAKMRDPASAAEILYTFKDQAGGEVPMLRMLVKLYLQCDRFGQADDALHRLLKLDPAHAVDTYQQIAVLAVERKRPTDAIFALEQIEILSGGQRSIYSLRAGVRDHLGLYADAALDYRRGMALQTDQVEEWLLWAQALASGGQKEQAVGRLQMLADQAVADDLFVVAVDGLLNLESPAPILRPARRRVLERLAQHPERLAFYNLAQDLSETSSDARLAMQIGEMSLLVAGEQRGSILRDLMTMAKTGNQSSKAMAWGTTLMMLGDQVPPRVFMDLGRQLLTEQRLTAADRAFSRAREMEPGDDDLTQQIAIIYEQAGIPEPAIRALKDVARVHVTDLSVKMRLGGLYEQAGQFTLATRYYQEVLDLLLKRQSERRQAQALAPNNEGTSARERRQRPGMATSVSEFQEYFDPALDGWIAAARTPELQRAAVACAEGWASDALNQLQDPPARLADCERLEFYSLVLRRAAFAFHQPQVADRFDQRLIKQFPTDAILRKTVIQERMAWGYTHHLASFPVATPAGTPRPKAATAPTSSPRVDAPLDISIRELLQSVYAGKSELARQQLRQISITKNWDRPAMLLLAKIAYSLDDARNTRYWIDQALPKVEKDASKQNIEGIIPTLNEAAHLLPESARPEILQRLITLSQTAKEDDRAELARVTLRWAWAYKINLPEQAAFISKAAVDANPPLLTGALQQVTPAQRPEVFEQIVTALAPGRQRQFMLAWLGTYDFPIEPALQNKIVKLFASNPPARQSGEERYAQLQQTGWNRNVLVASTSLALARQMLLETPKDPAVQMATALALQTAQGSATESAELARRATLALAARKIFARNETTMIADAVTLIPAAQQKQLFVELAGASVPPANLAFIKGQFLLQSGQTTEALVALRSAFELTPSNPEFRRQLLDTLEAEWQNAVLIETLMPFAHDETIVKGVDASKLVRALMRSRRYDEAQRLIAPGLGPVETMQRIQLALERGQAEFGLKQMRALLVENRRQRRYYTPLLPFSPTLGGLQEYLQREAAGFRPRTTVYAMFANQPFALAEYTALLDASVPAGREIDGILDGLVMAAARPEERQTLFNRLLQHQQADAFNVQDAALLAKLAKGDFSAAPPELVPQLMSLVDSFEPEATDALAVVARAAQSCGQTVPAQSLWRWVATADLVSGKIGGTMSMDPEVNLQRWKDAFKTLDKSTTQELRNAYLTAAQLAPLENPDDRGLVGYLELIQSLQGAPAAEALLAAGRSTGQITLSQMPRTCLFAAQLAALRGQVAEYQQFMQMALLANARRYNRGPIDLREALPDPAAVPDIASWLMLAQQTLDREQGVGRITVQDNIRARCLLGLWAMDHHLQPQAEMMFRQTLALAVEPGEQDLWLADLARKIGQSEQADRLEAKLGELNQLPAVRVPKK